MPIIKIDKLKLFNGEKKFKNILKNINKEIPKKISKLFKKLQFFLSKNNNLNTKEYPKME